MRGGNLESRGRRSGEGGLVGEEGREWRGGGSRMLLGGHGRRRHG